MVTKVATLSDVYSLFKDSKPDAEWSFANCTTKQTNALTHGYHK